MGPRGWLSGGLGRAAGGCTGWRWKGRRARCDADYWGGMGLTSSMPRAIGSMQGISSVPTTRGGAWQGLG